VQFFQKRLTKTGNVLPQQPQHPGIADIGALPREYGQGRIFRENATD
jgi:hypothetical protein